VSAEKRTLMIEERSPEDEGVIHVTRSRARCDQCRHWHVPALEHVPQEAPGRTRCDRLRDFVHEDISAGEGCLPEFWTPPGFGCPAFETGEKETGWQR